MPSYFIVRCTYQNIDDYKHYAKHAGTAVNNFKGKFLVKGTEEQSQKERGEHQKTVVVMFNGLDDAKSCYQSDDYQKALSYITNSSSRDFVIVEGLK